MGCGKGRSAEPGTGGANSHDEGWGRGWVRSAVARGGAWPRHHTHCLTVVDWHRIACILYYPLAFVHDDIEKYEILPPLPPCLLDRDARLHGFR